MAITIHSAAYAVVVPGTSKTVVSYTVPPGSGRVLVLATHHTHGPFVYAGQALTTHMVSDDPNVRLHTLIDPPVGTANLEVVSDDYFEGGYIVQAFDGVDTAALATPVVKSGYTGSGQVVGETLATAAGDLLVALVAGTFNVGITNGSGVSATPSTQVYDGVRYKLGTKLASGTSTTIDWTLSGEANWAHAALRLPVASGGATPPPAPTSLTAEAIAHNKVTLTWPTV
jgi:hypothetical protein